MIRPRRRTQELWLPQSNTCVLGRDLHTKAHNNQLPAGTPSLIKMAPGCDGNTVGELDCISTGIKILEIRGKCF